MGKFNTLIRLSRRDADYNLIERRIFKSRSWTLNMLGGLYQLHYMPSSAFPAVDALGTSRNLVTGSGAHYDDVISILGVNGGGGSGAWVHSMRSSAGSVERAEYNGIQIGSNGTGVTPTDYKLNTRIPHRELYTEVSETLKVALTTGDTAATYSCYGSNAKLGIILQAGYNPKAYLLTSMKLKLYRVGSPGTNCRVKVGTTEGGAELETSSDFNGNTITTDTAGEWVTVTFAGTTSIPVTGTIYFTLEAPSGGPSDYLRWRHTSSDAHLMMAGRYFTGSWVTVAGSGDFMVEIYGKYATSGMIYHGNSVSKEVYSAPNAEFTICRFFENKSGSTITVREIGLYATIGMIATIVSHTFCILRDIVSPAVDVLNNEILQVEIIPQIST